MIARAEIRLGTLVEVALPEADATDARFSAAFAAIAHVHRKMSAHDPASDLARIERDAHCQAIVVDEQTYAVLELALALCRETHGAFDPSVVRAPMRGYGASTSNESSGSAGAFATSMILERGNRVRTTAPIALDLGGIAKGHAVDRAIAALIASGARGGVVNAGGDLCAFGSAGWTPIRVRHPALAALAAHVFDVRDAAVATSADYFHPYGTLFEPGARTLRPFGASVTVVAPTCALADALTKVVALDAARAPRTLARHRAHALLLERRGDGVCATTTCGRPTSQLRFAV
jgi:thiamine biosynthesis lipoprotein